MNIGIFVYSQTGNTLSVAQKLEGTLRSIGHMVAIKNVKAVDDHPSSDASRKVETPPDISNFDTVIFAAPVQAFSLARPMKVFLAQIASLSGKKVYGFVTQGLKKPWLGGNRAIREITAACNLKGAELLASGIICWNSDTRESQINELTKRFTEIQ
ncbi:MAG TPA: flavodoxin [Oscillospiraceae bacterium]|mgnify:CR=1 FL=1|nr:flavodoxin [Oscillospiraceae bacterium]HPS35668.1 flavodoxin [Oscillospiraceae bacterium]